MQPDTQTQPTRGIAGSIKARIIRNFSWSFVGYSLLRVLYLVANVYLGRVLGVEGFGLFALVQSVALYFWFGVDMGTNLYGVREIARDKQGAAQVIGQLLSMRLLGGVLIYAVYAIGLMLIPMDAQKRVAFLCSGLYLITFSVNADWAFKGLEQFQYISLGSMLSSGTFMLGLLVLVHDPQDVTLAASLWSGSFVVGNGAMLWALRKRLGVKFPLAWQPAIWLKHLKESAYFAGSAGFSLLGQYIPMFTVGYFAGLYDVGLFAASQKLINALYRFGVQLGMSLYPLLSDLHKNDPRRFWRLQGKYQGAMFALGLPVALAGTFFSQEALTLLYGDKFKDGAAVCALMSWYVPLVFLRMSTGTSLLAMGLQHMHVRATSIGTAATAAACLLAVPRYGALGAAWAMILSECVLIVAMGYVFVKQYKREV